jgi:quercetin dioxygenase-like cupin family protein
MTIVALLHPPADDHIAGRKSDGMDLDAIKESVVVNVYHIPSDGVVPMHKHKDKDEIFYCIEGSGFGVLEDEEVELTPGTAFIAHAGAMHSLRSDDDLYVTAVLVPVVEDRAE